MLGHTCYTLFYFRVNVLLGRYKIGKKLSFLLEGKNEDEEDGLSSKLNHYLVSLRGEIEA